MIVTVLLLLICGAVQSSEIHPVAPVGAAPIVTAASSQYFERTFNRLVAVPPLLEPVPFAPAPVAPVVPVAPVPPPPVLSVLPIAPAPPVVVDATRTTAVPVQPMNPPTSAPVDPNIAIAIATAHAAPVATILLPPYPFGLPPSFGVLPQAPQPPQAPSDPNTRESTTLKTTTTVQATTTQREENPTTPLPSNIDNSFALPSNQDVNFKQYLAPHLPQQPAPQPQFPGPNQQFPGPNPKPQFPGPNPRPQIPVSDPRPQFPDPNLRPNQIPLPNPRPQQLPLPSTWPQNIPQHLPLPDARPIKFKTNVEVVPVPLAYIAPPSPHQHHHHNHHHHHHHHQSLKVVPHVHTFVPKTSKIIIRPVSSLRIRTLRAPAPFATYGPPRLVKRVALKYSQNMRSNDKELTTFRPLNRPLTTPPRL